MYIFMYCIRKKKCVRHIYSILFNNEYYMYPTLYRKKIAKYIDRLLFTELRLLYIYPGKQNEMFGKKKYILYMQIVDNVIISRGKTRNVSIFLPEYIFLLIRRRPTSIHSRSMKKQIIFKC